jgi:hypothetical protein
MFGLDNTSGVSVMPPIADKLNANPLWFTEGGGGAAASYPGKDWFNAIQAEIVNFIVASGLTPNKTDLTQITQAVLKSIQKSASSFANDTGIANAYVCNFTPAITARSEGQVLRFKVANTNNGASTVNDGVGIVPLVGGAHSALQGGELVAGGDAWVQWNSTVGTGSYVLLFCSGAPEQITQGAKPNHAATLAQVQSQAANFIADTGAANVYVAPLVPAAASYYDGMKVRLKIATTNTGSSTLNVSSLGAKTIYGGAHALLQGGELIASGYAEFEYNSTLGGFVLLFCTGAPEQISDGTQAKHAATVGQIQSTVGNKSLSVSVASNALTITVPAGTTLSFRSASLTDGTSFNVVLPAQLSLTVPSSATLGTISAVQANLAIVALYNGGSPILGIVNLAGGADLSESGLMTSTTISPSATSSAVVYSATGVTNSPYIVIGLIQITESAAGTWATAPTLVTPRGTNLISQLGGFGLFSTVTNVSASRVVGTTYYNPSSKPMLCLITATAAASGGAVLYSLNGATALSFMSSSTTAFVATTPFVVPPGGSLAITVTGGSTLSRWVECL